jgi:hypothetical protein
VQSQCEHENTSNFAARTPTLLRPSRCNNKHCCINKPQKCSACLVSLLARRFLVSAPSLAHFTCHLARNTSDARPLSVTASRFLFWLGDKQRSASMLGRGLLTGESLYIRNDKRHVEKLLAGFCQRSWQMLLMFMLKKTCPRVPGCSTGI